MTSLRSFHHFTQLPTELRLKIYAHIELLDLTRAAPPTLPPLSPVSAQALHILKISYSPSLDRYVSNTAPPVTLSICHESRDQTLLNWQHLLLGPSPKDGRKKDSRPRRVDEEGLQGSAVYQQSLDASLAFRTRISSLPSSVATSKLTNSAIPINYKHTILYISSLSLLLSTLHFQHTFLFHLSTSPSRHLIRYLAVDLRVWNDLCEHGFLGVLGRMKGLRELKLVVEFVSRLLLCLLVVHSVDVLKQESQYLPVQLGSNEDLYDMNSSQISTFMTELMFQLPHRAITSLECTSNILYIWRKETHS